LSVQGLPNEGLAETRQYAPSIPTRPGYVAAVEKRRHRVYLSRGRIRGLLAKMTKPSSEAADCVGNQLFIDVQSDSAGFEQGRHSVKNLTVEG
jgi:hypothetical protein